MKFERLAIPDVILIQPDVYSDSRGYFFEGFRDTRYEPLGVPCDRFCQDSVSYSHGGVLRGLHFQNPNSQGKLIHALDGEIFDVAVDIREGSPTFGKYVSANLSSENHHQLWIPNGFAHGFYVLSQSATVHYKVAGSYSPQDEHCLTWNDSKLNIQWPSFDPHLSEKDKQGLALDDLLQRGVLRFEG